MIWSLQVLRFFAAVMVVYIHAAETAARLTGSFGSIPFELGSIGLSGVDIFFVTSGFIIAKIAPGRTPLEFILSRFKRIVPIYFIFTIPALVTTVAVSGIDWRVIVATFMFWPATDVMSVPTLAVGWTLCFEMLFYISTALVLIDWRWAFAIVGAYGIAFVLRPFGPIFQYLGNPLILEFLFGVAVSYVPRWRSGIWGIPLGVLLLLGAGLLGIAPSGETLDFLQGQEGLRRVLVFGIPASLIVYGTLQVQVRESTWTYFGDASYSLYLSHPLLLTLLIAFWTNFSVPADVIILIDIVAALLFAWRVHEVIEKPLMDALKRWPQPSISPDAERTNSKTARIS